MDGDFVTPVGKSPHDPIVIDGLHYSESFEENDEGWWEPSCSCGKKLGVFPTAEDACDALMQHSYEAGYIDATDLYRSPRRA